MAGDLVRFVDSIAASPTVRLDVNDETSFWVKSFTAPPPRLRRSQSSNAMRDGVHVSTSNYDSRTVTMEIELRKSTQDAHATEMQKLFRELDRVDNYLMYQPTGATKPVFFKLYRSDTSQLEDVIAQAAMRTFTVELLAEPFALGLSETFSGTFSFDGASASGFKASSLPTVLGDVAAPLLLDVTLTNLPTSAWLVAQATPTALTSPDVVRAATNATLGTVGTDTSFSTGLSNIYWNTDAASVTFATNATLVSRLTGIAPTGFYGGTYRLIAHLLSDTGGSTVYTVRAGRGDSTGALGQPIDTGSAKTVALNATLGPLDTLADLGIFRVPFGTQGVTQASGQTVSGTYWSVQASRSSGSGTLRIDGLLWIQTNMDDTARASTALITPPVSASTTTPRFMRVDAGAESVSLYTGSLAVSDETTAAAVTGSLPSVFPGCTNSLWLIPTQGVTGTGTPTTTTIAYSAAYYPRYLFVRPSAT